MKAELIRSMYLLVVGDVESGIVIMDDICWFDIQIWKLNAENYTVRGEKTLAIP